MSDVVLEWCRREPPLTIAAVMGSGRIAASIAQGLMQRALPQGIAVAVHVDHQVVVAVGQSDQLPWVGGASWLGHDGPLLCPTTVRPTLPVDLVERAVRRRGTGVGPVIVTPDSAFVCQHPLVPVTSLDLALLATELSGTS